MAARTIKHRLRDKNLKSTIKVREIQASSAYGVRQARRFFRISAGENFRPMMTTEVGWKLSMGEIKDETWERAVL